MMSDAALFLGKFLRHGTAIASLAPSSRWLSRATVRGVDWERAGVILELGAGTGPITRVIAQRACFGCRVVVMERDPDFARLLRDRFPSSADFEIVEEDVRGLATVLKNRGIARVDHVISGLPVPSFPKELQEVYFRDVAEFLAPEGSYHQITEIPWVYQRFYRRHFREVQFTFEPRNLPPGGVYLCRGALASRARDCASGFGSD